MPAATPEALSPSAAGSCSRTLAPSSSSRNASTDPIAPAPAISTSRPFRRLTRGALGSSSAHPSLGGVEGERDWRGCALGGAEAAFDPRPAGAESLGGAELLEG